MTANTLNGNALNETRFPGAEAALAIIELVGSVQVVTELSSVKLRLGVYASGTSAANVSGTARLKLGAGGGTTAQAVASATPQSKVFLYPLATPAQASSLVSAVCYRRTGATGTGVATPAVVSYVYAKRGASVTASATITPARWWRYTYYAGSGTAVANGTVLALRKAFRSASESGVAVGVANTASRKLVSASGAAVATTSVSFVNVRRIVRVVGTGTATCSAYGRILVIAYPQLLTAQATSPAANAWVYLNTGGGSTEGQATGKASTRMKFSVGASTTAQAIAASGAEDFGLLISAPTERLMIVPASDRRMEVTL